MNQSLAVNSSAVKSVCPSTNGHGETARIVEYFSTVAEDALSGTIVFQPLSDDVTNQRLFHIVSGNEYDIFDMNHVTGSVALRHGVDYERRRCHEIILFRESPQDGSTVGEHQLFAVTVNVDDVNEFHPKFSLPVYHAVIVVIDQATVEQNGGMFVTSVRANDGDLGEYGLVEYHLEKTSADVTNPIRISLDRLTGDVKLVSLSFPTEIPTNFTVIAVDKGGLVDHALLCISVVINSVQTATSRGLFRRFTRDQYEFRVTGSSRWGHVLGEVGLVDGRGRRVFDDDVMYFVVNQNGSSSLFQLNATNGFIVYNDDDKTRQVSTTVQILVCSHSPGGTSVEGFAKICTMFK